MDKKSSIQENKRTKNMKKKKQKQANESAYRNNGNKIKKKRFIYSKTAWSKDLMVFFWQIKIKHKHLVKVGAFSGVKVSCMRDYANLALRNINPKHLILHVGMNDLTTEKTANQISRSIIELGTSSKKGTNTVSISAIVARSDELDNKTTEVSNLFVLMCQESNMPFLSHSDITDPSKSLNESKLYFNRQGMRAFAENISGFLTKLNWHQYRNGNILTKVSRKEFQLNVSNFNDSVSPSKDISSYEYELLSGIFNRSDCAQLNISSVRNKFDSLVNITNHNIDILMISEAKLDSSFPVRKILIHGFSEPYKLCRKSNGGGILVYIGPNLNMLSYRYENFLLLGDFNAEPTMRQLV